MAFQLQLAGSNTSHISFPAVLTNTLDGSSNGDWHIETSVYFDNTTAVQRLMGGNTTIETANRIFFTGNGSSLSFSNSGNTCIWNNLTNLTQNDFNTLRFEVGTSDTYPRLYVNGVLQTLGTPSGNFKSVAALRRIGVNFDTYSNLHIRSFAYVDNLNAANSRILSFNGAAGTPPISETANSTTITINGTGETWSEYGIAQQDPQLDTPQADVTIQEGQAGTIDLGANFSDANAGDTLTYSISPAMSAGFSFNTATGVITYNGSQAVAAAKTYTVICSDGNGGSPATDSFSITVVTASFIVDSISDSTPEAGTTISINYSNAGAAVTASCSAGTLNKVSDNGTTAVFDVPVPPLFGDKTLNYNTAFNITFSDGTNTDVESITIQVPAGEQFGQIATIDADGIYANDAGAAPGQYAHAKNISGDMVIDLTTGLVTYNPTVNNSFDYAIYDGVWGTYAAVAYTAETVKPVITLNGAASLVWVQNVAWVDPGATVTDNVDATRQITSSSAPNVSVVGSYSLAYNATDAAGNAADTVTRTVIVSSADTTPNQFTFVDVNNAELNTLYQNTQSITGVDAGQTLTATNGQLSNDNGVTWSSSCQMVTGQTLVRASVTTTGTNSLEHTQLVTVNGISDTFSVTTKAAVTRTFSIGSSDPVVDTQGANLTHTYGIWQLFDKIPEDTTAVLIDSGINFTVTNGVGSVQTSAAQPSTNYIFVARDSGNSPANYIRTVGQVA